MNDIAFCLAFHEIFGYGDRFQRVLEHFDGDVEAFFYRRHSVMRAAFLTASEKKKYASIHMEGYQRLFEECDKKQITILTAQDEVFPFRIGNIQPLPMVLYCQGEIGLLSTNYRLAVAGTKQPTEYGWMVTEKLVRELSILGCRIVTQLTRGLNSLAIDTAIHQGMAPIVLLPQGIAASYGAEAEILKKRVLEAGGLLLSPHYELYNSRGVQYQQIAVIMSVLSQGLLLTQAPEGSGTLKSASAAMKQGQKVFVVPGNILGSAYRGSNALINHGGILAEDGAFIASSLGISRETIAQHQRLAGDEYTKVLQRSEDKEKTQKISHSHKKKRQVNEKQEEDTGSIEQNQNSEGKKLVLSDFSWNTPLHNQIFEAISGKPLTTDELCEYIDGETGLILGAIIVLEAYGVVALGQDGRYRAL